MSEFLRAALAAGFDEKQAKFLELWVALKGHEHEVQDIVGFDEAVNEILDEDVDEDDEDED